MNRLEIPKYLQWKSDLIGENISPITYISNNFGLQDALILSYLFSPSFIEFRGSVFIEYQFSESNIDNWIKNLYGDMTDVQKVVNHLHITQLFLYDDANDDINFKMFKDLCEIIAYCWRGTLDSKYPHRKFVVETHYDKDDFDPYITFWEV